MKKFNTALVALLTVGLSSLPTMAKEPKLTPDLEKKGKEVYTANGCNACHGDKGDGSGPAAAALKPPPRSFTKGDFKNGNKPQNLFDSITKGLPGSAMSGYAHINETDRWALVAFVKSLSPKK
jgi:mono/diheme cytochrome c family protein